LRCGDAEESLKILKRKALVNYTINLSIRFMKILVIII